MNQEQKTFEPVVINGVCLGFEAGLAYLVGFFDAEGTLGIYFNLKRDNLSRGNINYRFSLTQNENANLISPLSEMLTKFGFPNSVRGHNIHGQRLEIQNRHVIIKLLDFLEATFGELPFRSAKLRNVLLIRALENPNLSPEEIVGLGFSFNKDHWQQENKAQGHSLEDACSHFNLKPSDVLKKSQILLKQIDAAYEAHKVRILSQTNVIVHPYYLTGLQDGDGSYLVKRTFTHFTIKGQKLFCVRFAPCFDLIVNANSLFTLKVYARTLEFQSSGHRTQKVGSTHIRWETRVDIQKGVDFFNRYKPVHKGGPNAV